MEGQLESQPVATETPPRITSASNEIHEFYELDNSVFGTMKINPKVYKVISNKNLFARTKYALAGLLFMFRREKSIRNVAKIAVIVFALAQWVHLDLVPLMMIFLSFGLLWAVETINSAIEAVVDLASHDIHPLAKVAKDVAASATFVATLTCFTTTMVFLLPSVLEKVYALVRQLGLI